jgi:hypothetical protein
MNKTVQIIALSFLAAQAIYSAVMYHLEKQAHKKTRSEFFEYRLEKIRCPCPPIPKIDSLRIYKEAFLDMEERYHKEKRFKIIYHTQMDSIIKRNTRERDLYYTRLKKWNEAKEMVDHFNALFK